MLVNVHTWIEFSNHNAPSCPCTPTASSSSTSSTASPTPSKSAATANATPPLNQQHHTVTMKYHEDDTDDVSEQDTKKVPGEFSDHTSPSCTSITSWSSVAPASSYPWRPSQLTTTSLSSSSSHLQAQDRECRYNEDEKKGKRRCRCSPHPEASLEGIHDTLHNLLGGGGGGGKGHMASPAVAGAC